MSAPALAQLWLALSLGSAPAPSPTPAETGTAESGTAESGTAESGTAESGTAESGTAESGTAETGEIAEAATAERVASYDWSPGYAPETMVDAGDRWAEPTPRWLRHKVLPNERLVDIAVRYGATVAGIARVNKLVAPPREDPAVHAAPPARVIKLGQRLKILARRAPPVPQLVTYTTVPGDTWVSVAVAHGVRYRKLRSWNWQYGPTLRAKREMQIYVESPATPTVYHRQGPRMPAVLVPDGGMSIGKPQKGKLRDGVRIPDTSLFDLRWPEASWGSSHAVRVVMTAAARFRHLSGFEGRLVLGAMSRPSGRRFPPHKSHQSGRDIDIFLPLKPGVHFSYEPTKHEIDWHASWALAMALLETGEIISIYLDERLHRFLFEAGRQLGATPKQLAALVEWPHGDGARRGIPIRHGKDHYRHFHIRIRCAPGNTECRDHPWAARVATHHDLPAPGAAVQPELWREP